MSFIVDVDEFDDLEYEVTMQEIIDNLPEFTDDELKNLHEEVHTCLRLPMVCIEFEKINKVQDLYEEADFILEYKTIDDEAKMNAFMRVFNEFDSWDFERMFEKMKKEKFVK